MPQPSKKLPKAHNAVRVARDNANLCTTTLQVARNIADADTARDPMLAMLLSDLIDRSARVEQRLNEIVRLHDELRARQQ